MNQLYTTAGISKQAVQQYAIDQNAFDKKLESLIMDADELRKSHPGCGVEKMYYTLKPDFIGRDRFIELFMQLGYRVKKTKNYRRTTYSSSIYYPNLIKGMKVRAPSVVWQSDITYIQLKDRFYYAVFIIDVYTKKIVGYQVSEHMRATANIAALKMALNNHSAPKVHHSDRGSQYTCKQYINLLISSGCTISMGLTAQDNAYAERINRTIKEEYLSYWTPKSVSQLKRYVTKAVNNYNRIRPHKNLNYQSPESFEYNWSLTETHLRPSLTIFDNLLTE